MFEIIDQSPQEGAIIKVIGVGGCGGNAVEHMIERGLSGVEFICANTDAQALRRSTARTQLQLGSTLTRGLGAGAKPEIGRDAAMEDRDRIAEMITGCRHAVHHRGHGWRHRNRRGAGHRGHREEPGHPDRRRRDASVPVRGQAAEGRLGRDRGAAEEGGLADHHPQRQADRRAGRGHRAARGVRGGQRRAVRRRIRHRRGHQLPGPGQRRLCRRAHGHGRGRHGDDGFGDGRRRGPRARGGRAGGQESAARGREPGRRARRARQRHRVSGTQDAASTTR